MERSGDEVGEGRLFKISKSRRPRVPCGERRIEEECTDGGGSCPTLVTHPTEMPCLAMV